MDSLHENEIRPPELHKKSLELIKEDILLFNKDDFIFVNCPACLSDKHQYSFSKNIFNFETCSECSTVFINPRPTKESLELYYKSSKSMAFWDIIYKNTENSRKEKIFKPRIKLVKKILQKYRFTDCKKLVEIGSGYGWFCELAQKEKLANKIIAIEPSPYFAKVCRNIPKIDVIELTVEEASDKLNADVIVNFELIEHLFDPSSFLKSCYKGLRKGGLLICSTPNFLGLDISILREKSDNVLGPNHLNYFNPKSIKFLLISIGFKNIEISTPGLLDTEIILNKIRSDELRALDYPFFNFLLKSNPKFIADFQNLLRKHKMSSNMLISAQK